jgi:hypothetical protein
MSNRPEQFRSMYERAMGERYAELPAAVQRFHRLGGYTVLHGWVETLAPASPVARLLAMCLGSPRRASQGPIRFELQADANAESWTRHFPTQSMSSRLQLVDGHIVEHLGATRLQFALTTSEGVLRMALVGLRFLGCPCPRWLMPVVVAQERGDADQLHFEVSASLPKVGIVASYRGHLILNPTKPK